MGTTSAKAEKAESAKAEKSMSYRLLPSTAKAEKGYVRGYFCQSREGEFLIR